MERHLWLHPLPLELRNKVVKRAEILKLNPSLKELIDLTDLAADEMKEVEEAVKLQAAKKERSSKKLSTIYQMNRDKSTPAPKGQGN